MRRLFLSVVVIVSILAALFVQASRSFDDYFVDKTMRIDYFHTGNAGEEEITIDQVYEQGVWAGSLRSLIDDFQSGRYAVKVFDSATGKLIFSRGFDSYFGEYKTTDRALRGIKRTYHESVLIPYPKKKITWTLEVRNRENLLQPLFSQEIDPAAVSIIREKPSRKVEVLEVMRNGHSHQKVDLVFVAEGYTMAEREKFIRDLDRFTAVFFGFEPYRTYRENFNIFGVFMSSEESGCDEPRRGIFRKTALSATFNSLGSERYLLTEDNKSLRDIAGCAPYDALLIMVNHGRYGGGGIYNLYCTFTVDNQWAEYLLLHEFGHSFAGLADEYYTSSVAYNEFYPQGIEPLEPNITALLDPGNLKWKAFLTPGIEIPTPWEKEEFDRMDEAYQNVRAEIGDRIARMKREGAPVEEVAKVEEEAERLSRDHARKIDEYLLKSQFWGKVGAFEGAGYSARNLYRPMLDCLMFSKGRKSFCRVCERAVIRVIKHYSE